MSKSLSFKIALALIAAVAFALPPVMFGVGHITAQSLEDEMRVRRLSVVEMHSAALAKPLFDFEYDAVERAVDILARDHDIDGVEVRDLHGEVIARSRTFPTDVVNEASVNIVHHAAGRGFPVGVMRIAFNDARLSNAAVDFYWRSGVVITAALIAVMIVLMLAVRNVVLRPLEAMTEAVEASRHESGRPLVAWRSHDEIGALVRLFNEMQLRLRAEEEGLKRANARLNALYNETPAMLFSLDNEWRVVEVSEYWLAETGYARADVIEKPLSEFVECGGACDPSANLARGFEQWACRFRKKNGVVIEVLVCETAHSAVFGGDVTLAVMVDITELKRAETELIRRARTDSLTGLPNRRALKEHLAEEVGRAAVQGGALEVLFVDLDRFKWVNDTLGHQAGDEILSQTAARIKTIMPDDAFFARLGGDEFALCLSHFSGAPKAAQSGVGLALAINEALEQPFSLDGRTVTISASIGLANYPGDAKTVGCLLRAADLAMYRTKKSGRRGYSIYNDSIGQEAQRLYEIEQLMKTGGLDRRFHMMHQPVVAISGDNPDGDEIIGAEALIRMIDEEGRIVSPADFIPVAEECGLMPELGAFALRRALADMAGAPVGANGRPLRTAVNLSPTQITPDLPDQVAWALEAADFSPNRLVLEITETVFLKNDPSLKTVFMRLRDMGCKLALDDFGTGYSSLGYLNEFSVDLLKIDRDFVKRLDAESGDDATQRRTRSLLQGIVTIADSLGIEVVAEGVETTYQRAVIADLGVALGQGFYWAPPKSIDAFSAIITEKNGCVPGSSSAA